MTYSHNLHEVSSTNVFSSTNVTTYNTIDVGLPETIHCICGELAAENQMEWENLTKHLTIEANILCVWEVLSK
jgi:hypothetical protein